MCLLESPFSLGPLSEWGTLFRNSVCFDHEIDESDEWSRAKGAADYMKRRDIEPRLNPDETKEKKVSSQLNKSENGFNGTNGAGRSQSGFNPSEANAKKVSRGKEGKPRRHEEHEGNKKKTSLVMMSEEIRDQSAEKSRWAIMSGSRDPVCISYAVLRRAWKLTLVEIKCTLAVSD